MNRGIYTATSAMMAGSKLLDEISSNLANVSTAGFKRDVGGIGGFEKEMQLRLNDMQDSGELANQVGNLPTRIDFKQGAFSMTGISTDYAVQGEGFFKVLKNGQTFYTRDGHFTYDADGNLSTADGSLVLSNDNTPVTQGGEKKVAVFVVSNIDALVKVGDNRFSSVGATESLLQEAGYQQGMLECSNVELSEEMTKLMNDQKYFSMNQRAFRTNDEILEKLCNF